MSLGDLLKFEGFNGKKILKGIWEKPQRLITGIDPASTKLWNGVLGRNDEPLVDQFGGATKKTFGEAEASGIDTGSGKTAHGIAHVVAAMMGGQGLANTFGAGGGLSGTGNSSMTAGMAKPTNMQLGANAIKQLPSLLGTGAQPGPAPDAQQNLLLELLKKRQIEQTLNQQAQQVNYGQR